MTLQEAKEQIAKKNGYEGWNRIHPDYHERYLDEAAELYAERKYEGMKALMEVHCERADDYQRELQYLNNQSIAIDKLIFSEDLSIFEKVQEIQKMLK